LAVVALSLVLVVGVLPLSTGSGSTTAEETTLLSEGFEAGFNTSNFPTVQGASVSTDCGASSGSLAATFATDEPRRFVTTRPVDADAGATIAFSYTTGWTSGDRVDTCPRIDEDKQRPVVQYSNDGGNTWHTLTTLDTRTDGFEQADLRIDANEGSERTIVRWIQHRHDGAGADNWAIDDVKITTPVDEADPVLEADEADLGGLGRAGYAFRRTIVVENDGPQLSDPTVEVVLDTAALVSQEKLQADCDDLRFTATIQQASHLLDHEVASSCDTNATEVGVDVPSVPSGKSTFQLFYGDRYGGSDAPVDPVDPPAQSQLSVSVGTEQAYTSTNDADGDGLPDTLEQTLCSPGEAFELIRGGDNIGACRSETDYVAQPMPFPYTLQIPQWTTLGPDHDGDGVPGTLAAEWFHVTFSPKDPKSPFAWNGGVTTHKLDPDDSDPGTPTGDEACVVIPRQTTITFSGDTDGDGVPHEVQNHGPEVCMQVDKPGSREIGTTERTREWTLDPDDLDPARPNTSLPSTEGIPTWAAWDRDRDGDGLPARGTIDQFTLTFDTRRLETNLAPSQETTVWDADDQDDRRPPSIPVDVDGDHVPETNELHACEAEDPRTTLDGFCTNLGTNYHPARGYPSSFEPLLDPSG
jgi:hypothetical protein